MKIKTILIPFVIIVLYSNTYGQTCYFTNLNSFGGKPTNYSGNSNLDYFLTNEYNQLVRCFGVKPNSFYIYEDNLPNAFASSSISNNSLPDGTVVLGLKLTNQECFNSPSGTCVAMAVVLSHEFAHILDFKNNFVIVQGKKKELFADYMAGVYLHTRQLIFAYTDMKEAAYSIFTKGDSDFNSPSHHGTSTERMNALLAGYEFSKNKVASGIYNFSVFEAMNSAKIFLNF